MVTRAPGPGPPALWMVRFARMPTTAGSAGGYPAPFRPPWWMLALAAAFASYFALLVHSDLTRPEFTGFVADIDAGVVTLHEVSPESPAARAGLVPADRVVAV